MIQLVARVAGGAAGGGIISAFGVLYKLLTDPDVLLQLYNALTIHTNPGNVIGRIAAAIIGLVLSIAVAIVAALFHPSPLQATPPKG